MCFRPAAAVKQDNKCPACQTINADGVEVCGNCGAALPRLAPAPGAPGVKAPGAVPPPGVSGPPKAPSSAPKMPQAAPRG